MACPKGVERSFLVTWRGRSMWATGCTFFEARQAAALAWGVDPQEIRRA